MLRESIQDMQAVDAALNNHLAHSAIKYHGTQVVNQVHPIIISKLTV